MPAGTGRIGLTSWGTTRPSRGLWQRLYLRPLPHQHRSFERNTVVDVVGVAMAPGYASWLRARRPGRRLPAVSATTRRGGQMFTLRGANRPEC